ncbi:MAG: hypothetical protein L0I76_28510 [Pseudonocardia sp.]|nr:hypothetical protein [Pseudonocardia sp.]
MSAPAPEQLAPAFVCDRCDQLHDPARGVVCPCRTPFDPREVAARTRVALARGRRRAR